MVERREPVTLPELPELEDDTSGFQPILVAWDEVHAQMWRAFRAKDYGRAIDLGDRFVQAQPGHAEARLFVEECRLLLEDQLTRRLSPLERIAVARAPLESLATAKIDPKTAFLLSQVDGLTTLDDLVDLAPMPRADALRIVAAALDGGLIALEA